MDTALGRGRSGLVLAAVATLLGFGGVSLAFATASVRRADAPRRTELINLINDRKSQVGNLDAAVRDLRAKVLQAQDVAGRLTAGEKAQAGAVDRLAVEAGAVAMAGPGLTVRLADSNRRPADLAQADAYRIHDLDLQLVVNALWDAGAEAVAVNNNRLVATTPIRGAGQTIVVNFRPLNGPYVVTALGASRARFEASEIAHRFHRWTTVFGLGFGVKDSARLVEPAYTGRVAISTASPVITDSSSPSTVAGAGGQP